MKSTRIVKNKLRQAKYRHFAKILAANFKQEPFKCLHNMELPLEDLDTTLYFCGVQPATICDPNIRGCNAVAKECTLFEPQYTKEELKEKWEDFFENSSIEVINKDFPDIAILMWVLEEDTSVERGLTDVADYFNPPPDPISISENKITIVSSEIEMPAEVALVPIQEPFFKLYSFIDSIKDILRRFWF